MTSHLAERIRKYAKATSAGERPSVDERPGCTHGAVTRQRLSDLDSAVGRLETKVNAILGGVAVAIVLDLVRGWQP